MLMPRFGWAENEPILSPSRSKGRRWLCFCQLTCTRSQGLPAAVLGQPAAAAVVAIEHHLRLEVAEVAPEVGGTGAHDQHLAGAGAGEVPGTGADEVPVAAAADEVLRHHLAVQHRGASRSRFCVEDTACDLVADTAQHTRTHAYRNVCVRVVTCLIYYYCNSE